MVSGNSGPRAFIVGFDDPILVTGAGGFVGSRVVNALLQRGFTNIRCFVRPASSRGRLSQVIDQHPGPKVEIVEGNLLSRNDCRLATRNVRVIFHVAAGNEKSFAGCFLNSVVSTRNVLESIDVANDFRRFVNVSSLAVYSNYDIQRRALLDETCPVETQHVLRNEPYAYAKLKQDEIVLEYAARYGIPHVIVRPGPVYGPGNAQITGRVGLRTFGIFMHLGGRNPIPFTHVDNCAAAIALAGITRGVDGEIFNIVDDGLPTSRQFLSGYKKNVGSLRYISVPYPLFYLFCSMWEWYSRRSGGQLPPVFNRRKCAVYWKGNRYSNRKAKELLEWTPSVSFDDGARAYYASLRKVQLC